MSAANRIRKMETIAHIFQELFMLIMAPAIARVRKYAAGRTAIPSATCRVSIEDQHTIKA